MTTTTERDEAVAHLREILHPGDTVYTILRHVSRSGMQRRISLVTFKYGDPYHLNYLAGKALGHRVATGWLADAVICNGAGMDMGFDLVDSLAHAVFGHLSKDWGEVGNMLTQRWL